jgi:hypothetical protein
VPREEQEGADPTTSENCSASVVVGYVERFFNVEEYILVSKRARLLIVAL